MDQTSDSPTARLKLLGISLPPLRKPVASYVPFKQSGNLIFLSGQGPVNANGVVGRGKVGLDLTTAEAYQHARTTGLTLLAVLAEAAGSLDNITDIVKVLGFVNGSPDFNEHPQVINGCSDLLIEVFGEKRGRHARSAIGAGSLPRGISVEIEMIVAVGGAGGAC